MRYEREREREKPTTLVDDVGSSCEGSGESTSHPIEIVIWWCSVFLIYLGPLWRYKPEV